MKYSRTPQFWEDFNGLEDSVKKVVNEAFPNLAKALEGDVALFNYFRIKKLEGWPGIWEGHVKGQNLCFTFHYDTTETGEKVCFFRRVGTHKIYKKP